MSGVNAQREPTRALTLRAYTVSLGGVPVVKAVNLQAESHRVTAIIGPSGSGKSVLLKSLVRLLHDELETTDTVEQRGEADFLGEDLLKERSRKELRALRRRLVYLTQSPAPFPMSIEDNVTLALRYWSPELRKSEVRAITERVLTETLLWDEVKDRLGGDARELSAGQLQRLSLARALTLKPQMLLLDEPCANTDPRTTAELEDLFFGLRCETTIMIVTHNMQQAARISDHAAFMYQGLLREFGETAKLFTNPEDRTLEHFITGRFG